MIRAFDRSAVLASLASLSVVLFAVACGPHQSYAPYGNVDTLAEEQYNETKLPPYTIQAGDRLSIEFARNPDLDQEALVRPDGMISLPFVDEVRAAGLSPQALDSEIERRYRGELAEPEVTVVVIALGGTRVFVDGEVTKPGMFDLTAGMTLMSAISSAGGMTPRAHPQQVIIVRRGPDGKPVGHSVDLSDVVKGQSTADDVLLQPFDIVYVPRTKIANANLWIKQYITDMLPIRVRLRFVLFI